MKLIIDIPEWYYNEVKEFKHPVLIDKSIMNGTPFDSVIEDIKADINNIDSMTFIGNGSGCASEMRTECLKIIDKHMRGDK